MSRSKPFNRNFAILGAVLIQFNLGAIYAWSVFTPALKETGWTNLETQMVFSFGLASFSIVMVFAGRAMAKYGPQKMAVAGGLTLGAGYLLAGLLGGENRRKAGCPRANCRHPSRLAQAARFFLLSRCFEHRNSTLFS